MALQTRAVFVSLSAVLLALAVPLHAQQAEFLPLHQPWPKQMVRDLEVGRHPVRWRHRVSRAEGLFAGVRFQAPTDRATTWKLATDYSDVGRKTPGITAVHVLEQTATRQLIQIDAKVLWKTISLIFEVEQDPPQRMTFRLQHSSVGTFEGVCVFDNAPDAPGVGPTPTIVELSSHLKPTRPVPLRLLLTVERMTFLKGVKEFLETCERHR